MKVVRYDGEPEYSKLDVLYQLQVTDIPKTINIEEIILEEAAYGEQYYPDCWIVRGSFDFATNEFSFDNCLIYICCSEYFYDYEFSNKEKMEMIKVCMENTDLNRIQ